MEPHFIRHVQQHLPDVLVTWRGERWWAKVTGRLNKHASVAPYATEKPSSRTVRGPIVYFSWDAVARAHFRGTILDCEEE